MNTTRSSITAGVLAALLLWAPRAEADCPRNLTGAIFTTTADGQTVNGNIYDHCCDVYLNGGPQPKAPCTAAGLPDGDYYFQVTDPSGKNLLSFDDCDGDGNDDGPEPQRRFTVSGGVITAYLGTADDDCFDNCGHALGGGKCPGSISIQLMKFSATPNPGGEYKVWVTPVDCYDPTDTQANFGFIESKSKTDNFKCRDSVCVGPDCPLELSCPLDIEVDCEGVNGAFVHYADPIPSGGQPPYDVSCEPPSGSLFAPGETTVTCTVTDAHGEEAECSFKVTVTGPCPPPCEPECPLDIEQCNDDGQCGAIVEYDPPVCPNATVECEPEPGSFFAVGTTEVTCTATDPTGFVETCTFEVTIRDCEAPQVECPDDLEQCNDPGQCGAVVSFEATATDNCDPDVSVSCDPPSGSVFPLGTTEVTCTATDAAGNETTCSFNVTVKDCTVGSICGKKFYDANANGRDDDGQAVAGWKVVLSGDADAVTYTNARGEYCFENLGPGTYTVTEIAPNASWLATTETSCTFTISCENLSNDFTCNFGNLCLDGGGGRTLGFWSNKNGQAQMNDGGTAAPELALLSGLCLRNAAGAHFDPADYSSFRTWILNATAVNMAYMLSAQLAAMQLNVEAGFVNAASLVYAPGCGNFISIADLIAAANAALCDDGFTPAGDPNRAWQECLKNALDRANNNLNFVQSRPCGFRSPY